MLFRVKFVIVLSLFISTVYFSIYEVKADEMSHNFDGWSNGSDYVGDNDSVNWSIISNDFEVTNTQSVSASNSMMGLTGQITRIGWENTTPLEMSFKYRASAITTFAFGTNTSSASLGNVFAHLYISDQNRIYCGTTFVQGLSLNIWYDIEWYLDGVTAYISIDGNTPVSCGVYNFSAGMEMKKGSYGGYTYVDDLVILYGELAPSPPTLPSNFDVEPFDVAVTITATEEGDMEYYVERENGTEDVMVVAGKEYDMEVNDEYELEFTAFKTGVHHVFARHEVDDEYSDYSTVDVDVTWEEYSPDENDFELLFPDSGNNFTTSASSVDLVFETPEAGSIECVNASTGEVYYSMDWILNDGTNNLPVTVDLADGANDIKCYLKTDQGIFGEISVTATYEDDEVPLLLSSGENIYSRYHRFLVDISENTVDDLYCKINSGDYFLVDDTQSDEVAYFDYDINDIEEIDEFSRFSFELTCYFDDDASETKVIASYTYANRHLNTTGGSVFCSSLNVDWGHLDDTSDSGWFKKKYAEFENMLIDTPLLGDMIYLNCYFYNNIFLPVKNNDGGFPAVYTPDSADISYSEFSFTIDLKLKDLHDNLEVMFDGVDSDSFETFQDIITAVVWLWFLLAIYGFVSGLNIMGQEEYQNDPFNQPKFHRSKVKRSNLVNPNKKFNKK